MNPKKTERESAGISLSQSLSASAKSLFQSRTFWGVALTAVAAIAPVVGAAVKEGRLSVDQAVNIVIVLCGAGSAVAGRVQAKDAVYTPDWAPGPNRSDFPEAPR